MPLKKRSRRKKRERNRRRVGTAVAAAILLGWLLAPSGHRDDLTMDDDSIADASLLDASDSSAVDNPDSDVKAPSKRQEARPGTINPFDRPSTNTDSLVALDLGEEGGAEIVADLVNAVDTGGVADVRPSLSAYNGYSDSGGYFGGVGGFFGGAGVGAGGGAPPAYTNRRSSGIAGQRGSASSETASDDSPAAEETGSSNAGGNGNGGNGNGHGGNVTFAPNDPKSGKGPVTVLPTDDSGDTILTDPDAPVPPGKPGPGGDAPTTPPVANPEPASLLLLGSGLALTAHTLRQRRRNR